MVNPRGSKGGVAAKCADSPHPVITTKGEAMHAVTKRTINAAVALAAAGLFGSVPYPGDPQALQGAPTVHRDVALVDNTVVVDDEIQADNAFWDSNLGTFGGEEQLYDDLGGNTTFPASIHFAQAILDTNGANPPWSGDFNGTETRLTEGLFVGAIYAQDEVNQLLGFETAGGADQQAFATDILDTESVPLPSGLEPGFTLDPGPNFDSELLTLDGAEYTNAFTDLEGYLADLPGNLSSLDGGVSGLSGDLTTVLGDLTGGLL
jgi:hypothetical protein